jgi:colicin import membrane protein
VAEQGKLKVKVDKTLVASIALHVLVLGWGLVSFSTKAYVLRDEETVADDVISSDQLAHVMAGQRTGKKENPKPLVEKVAEAKPVDDAVGKIEEKKPPVVTDTAPPPTPKVEEKPVEKKPDPPKQVTETKPKDEPKKEEPKKEEAKQEPKPVEKKPDPAKPDPIAEAIKKEEKKPPPKPQQQAAKPPPEQKPKERVFDQSKIAALLDKRDPTRQAAAGDTLNSNAALGLAHGKAADNSATWGAMFKQQVERCWKKPYGGIEAQQTEAAFVIRLKRDGTLEGMPVPEGTAATPYLRVYQESALRAIIECQPYNLPAAYFDEWKYFSPVFTERKT